MWIRSTVSVLRYLRWATGSSHAKAYVCLPIQSLSKAFHGTTETSKCWTLLTRHRADLYRRLPWISRKSFSRFFNSYSDTTGCKLSSFWIRRMFNTKACLFWGTRRRNAALLRQAWDWWFSFGAFDLVHGRTNLFLSQTRSSNWIHSLLIGCIIQSNYVQACLILFLRV